MANIIKRVWNQNRMVQIEDLKGMTFQAEQAGHTFQISGIDDEGNTVALTGTPSGVLLRPDNTDVALTCSVSGGVVSATLPANCYDVPGRFGLTIFITFGSSKTAIYAAVGTVSRTSSGTAAPGTTQSVVDLINAINAAVNSIPASYSDLLADIAPTYSNSALYSVGQYAWYDGDLKRCIVPITTAESYTAAHWTSAVLGQDVSDLKSAFNEEISKNLFHCTSYDIGYRASTDVANGNTDYYAVNDYFPVESGATYSFGFYSKSTGAFYANFSPILTYYDASKTHLGYAQVSDGEYTIPSTASFIRVSVGKTSYATYNIQIEKGTSHTSYEEYYDYLVLKNTSNGLTGTVTELSSNVSALNGRFDRIVSKNLFHITSYDVGYRASSDTANGNTSYIAVNDYYPVESGEKYCFSWLNSAKLWLANFNPILCYYDASKTHLGWAQVEGGLYTMPNTAKYIRISMSKSQYEGNNYFQIEKGESFTSYEQYYDKTVLKPQYIDDIYLNENYDQKVIVNVITVGSSAGCDYAKVQDAIASITDNDELNRYVIYIEPGEYDLASDFTAEQISGSTFVGITVPDWCKLIGIGDRDSVVLTCELEEIDENIAALNFKNTASIENLTVISVGCRYTIHDDNAVSNGAKGYQRVLKNCRIKGINNYYNSVYGAGLRENADWYFENCIFDASQVDRTNVNGIAWFVHNNANFNYPCNIKFVNCRFITSMDNGAVVLRSITNNANGVETYVQLYGCKLGTGAHGLHLKEENAGTYGSGCLFRATGFGNQNATYTITVTDGHDYSDHVDFI